MHTSLNRHWVRQRICLLLKYYQIRMCLATQTNLNEACINLPFVISQSDKFKSVIKEVYDNPKS